MRIKQFFLSLGTLVASALFLVGIASPASASTQVSISLNSFAPNSTTSAFTITVPSTGSSIGSWNEIIIGFSSTSNTAWPVALSSCPMGAPVSLADCGVQSISIGGSIVGDAVASKLGNMIAIKRPMSGQTQQFFTSSTSNEVIVTFSSGTFTTPATAGNNYQATVNYNGNPPPTLLAAPISVAAGSSYTVTFDANGGSGSMSAQTASSATALTANAFTKSGFTFGGWASSSANAAAGTVAYANSASYPFTSSTMLYAIWTASNSGGGSSDSSTLARTGGDGAVSITAALSALLLGSALVFWRRKRSAS